MREGGDLEKERVGGRDEGKKFFFTVAINEQKEPLFICHCLYAPCGPPCTPRS